MQFVTGPKYIDHILGGDGAKILGCIPQILKVVAPAPVAPITWLLPLNVSQWRRPLDSSVERLMQSRTLMTAVDKTHQAPPHSQSLRHLPADDCSGFLLCLQQQQRQQQQQQLAWTGMINDAKEPDIGKEDSNDSSIVTGRRGKETTSVNSFYTTFIHHNDRLICKLCTRKRINLTKTTAFFICCYHSVVNKDYQ